jgi:hypothetical protein
MTEQPGAAGTPVAPQSGASAQDLTETGAIMKQQNETDQNQNNISTGQSGGNKPSSQPGQKGQQTGQQQQDMGKSSGQQGSKQSGQQGGSERRQPQQQIGGEDDAKGQQ